MCTTHMGAQGGQKRALDFQVVVSYHVVINCVFCENHFPGLVWIVSLPEDTRAKGLAVNLRCCRVGAEPLRGGD